jgi:hypothetical protein
VPEASLNLLRQASLNLLRQASKIRDLKNEKPLAYNLAHHDLCDSDEDSKKVKWGGPEASSCILLNPTATTTVWSTTNPTPAPGPTLPVITSGSKDGTCGGGKRVGPVGINSKPINKNALQKCLLNLDTSKWPDAGVGAAMDCEGMVSFQSASHS